MSNEITVDYEGADGSNNVTTRYVVNEDGYICESEGIDPTSPILVECDETIVDESGEVDYDKSRDAEEEAMQQWANEIQKEFPGHSVFVAPCDGKMIARLDEEVV